VIFQNESILTNVSLTYRVVFVKKEEKEDFSQKKRRKRGFIEKKRKKRRSGKPDII